MGSTAHVSGACAGAFHVHAPYSYESEDGSDNEDKQLIHHIFFNPLNDNSYKELPWEAEVK